MSGVWSAAVVVKKRVDFRWPTNQDFLSRLVELCPSDEVIFLCIHVPRACHSDRGRF